MATKSTLIGRWEKLADGECDRLYPGIVEFFEATYRGAKSADQGFIVWDAGIWREDAPGTVLITTAGDELVRYTFTLSDDVLTFRDAEGCEFSYRRHDF
ncbi:hypothetical protein AB0I10_18505 [Streptomyces sp. NPDC050636]|uniref:hypothetical protein n=1 Tax=Streptomyces sp. NPDC050636 TaxID=3154510 RepID=UPI003413B192